jgi:hypothetical protein
MLELPPLQMLEPRTATTVWTTWTSDPSKWSNLKTTKSLGGHCRVSGITSRTSITSSLLRVDQVQFKYILIMFLSRNGFLWRTILSSKIFKH